LKTVTLKICCGRKTQLIVSNKVMTNPCCGLAVIFCGLITPLIGRETINIPEIFSGVHGFMGKTVIYLVTCMQLSHSFIVFMFEIIKYLRRLNTVRQCKLKEYVRVCVKHLHLPGNLNLSYCSLGLNFLFAPWKLSQFHKLATEHVVFLLVYIASFEYERGWENSRQLCKPDMQSGICITFDNSPNLPSV